MTKDEIINAEFKKFTYQYRTTTSADWQTYTMGLTAGYEACAAQKDAEIAAVKQELEEFKEKRDDENYQASLKIDSLIKQITKLEKQVKNIIE